MPGKELGCRGVLTVRILPWAPYWAPICFDSCICGWTPIEKEVTVTEQQFWL